LDEKASVVSMVTDAHSTSTWDERVVVIADGIRLGKWRLQIEDIRRVYGNAVKEGRDAKKAIKPLKKKLPGILWVGGSPNEPMME